MLVRTAWFSGLLFARDKSLSYITGNYSELSCSQRCKLNESHLQRDGNGNYESGWAWEGRCQTREASVLCCGGGGGEGWVEEWQKEWQHRTCRIKSEKSLKDAACNGVRVGRNADNWQRLLDLSIGGCRWTREELRLRVEGGVKQRAQWLTAMGPGIRVQYLFPGSTAN